MIGRSLGRLCIRTKRFVVSKHNWQTTISRAYGISFPRPKMCISSDMPLMAIQILWIRSERGADARLRRALTSKRIRLSGTRLSIAIKSHPIFFLSISFSRYFLLAIQMLRPHQIHLLIKLFFVFVDAVCSLFNNNRFRSSTHSHTHCEIVLAETTVYSHLYCCPVISTNTFWRRNDRYSTGARARDYKIKFVLCARGQITM